VWKKEGKKILLQVTVVFVEIGSTKNSLFSQVSVVTPCEIQ